MNPTERIIKLFTAKTDYHRVLIRELEGHPEVMVAADELITELSKGELNIYEEEAIVILETAIDLILAQDPNAVSKLTALLEHANTLSLADTDEALRTLIDKLI